MLPQWLSPYVIPIINYRSINYLINTYIECLGYLFPVLIVYLCTQDLNKTLLVFVIIILIRFLVAFYQIIKSQQQPPKVAKYRSCHYAFYIDPIQKVKLQKECQLKYQQFKKKQNQMSFEKKKAKDTDTEAIMKQIQQKQFTIYYKWQ